MTERIKHWFAILSEVQRIVKGINSDAEDDLKEFSKQKLGDLLKDEFDQNELSTQLAACGFLVPDSAYNDMAKTFLWFVDAIGLLLLRALLHELYYWVARKINPTVFTSTEMPSSFPDRTLSEVYGNAAAGSQPAGGSPQSVLDKAVEDAVHASFYPGDPAYLDPANTVRKSVGVIID